MTIQDVLNTVNVMYPNTYDNDDKIKILKSLAKNLKDII